MDGLVYNKDDIIKALTEAGLQDGDTAYFSTGLGMIGVAEGVKDPEDLNHLFFEAITKVLGKTGTILVPSYSYTFNNDNRNKPNTFDPETTPANVGPFPNFFLKQKGVIRSMDPMMSVAGLGIHAEKLFKDLPPTSYGDDSLYARLVHHPYTKCVSLGLGPNWVPFLHHADWLAQVPFRYDKLFFGKIKQCSKIKDIYWVYSVRALIDQSIADAHRLGEMAVERGIWSHAPLGRARIYACDYKKFFDFTMALLKDNKWLTARGPACNVLGETREKVELEPRTKSTKSPDQDLHQLVQDTIGADTDEIFPDIRAKYPIDIYKFKTGTTVYDWIVPEKQCLSNGRPFMAEMSVGEWVLEGETSESVLLCCYLDAQIDPTLSGLTAWLAVMRKIQANKTRKFTYRLAVLPSTIGYAAYLTKLRQIRTLGAVHLTEVTCLSNISFQRSYVGTKGLENVICGLLSLKNISIVEPKSLFDPLASGNNPIAKHTLEELTFDNVVMGTSEKKQSAMDKDASHLDEISSYLYQLLSESDKNIRPL